MTIDKRILDYDPMTGVTEYFYYDSDEDKCIIQQVQNTDVIVEQNKSLLAQSSKHDRYGEWSKVASIPMTIWADLNAKGIIRDKDAFRKWLNDPDNKYFRTREGRV